MQQKVVQGGRDILDSFDLQECTRLAAINLAKSRQRPGVRWVEGARAHTASLVRQLFVAYGTINWRTFHLSPPQRDQALSRTRQSLVATVSTWLVQSRIASVLRCGPLASWRSNWKRKGKNPRAQCPNLRIPIREVSGE
jgi:hypothetical protein